MLLKISQYSEGNTCIGMCFKKSCRPATFYEIVNKKAPQYLIDYLPAQDLASINLRKRRAIYPLDARTERYCNSFFLIVFHNGTFWIVV